MEKNNKKTIRAWAMFDWANSVYSLIIATAIFPIYYTHAVNSYYDGEFVPFLFWEVKGSSLYSYSISFSFLVIVILSPILSGIADYSGKKKQFMKFFTYLGSLSCAGLFFFTGANIVYGIACSTLASIGFAGSIVFYNGFLPEIASKEKMDKVSALGFSLGYIGSIILLAINLIIIMKPELFDLDPESAISSKIAFVMVGVWWAGFAQIPFNRLKDKPVNTKKNVNMLTAGYKEINKVLQSLKGNKTTSRFLIAFFAYSMGVQTLIYMAGIFGANELEMEDTQLILLILIIQFVAIAGAYLFAFISKKLGNGFAISIALIIWAIVSVLGSKVHDAISFIIIGSFVGLVMGGIQSISRSTYSKLIPKDTKDTASYFSFFDVTEKLAIVLGTLAFGYIDSVYGMRTSILSLAVLFILGLIILQTAKLKEKLK